MAVRFRLIPAVMVAASALLGLKTANFFLDGGVDSIAAAWAQTTMPAASAATAPPVALTPAAAPAATPAPADGKPTPAAAQTPASAPVASSNAKDPLLMSPAEVEVLQNLSSRRAELDKQTADLREREVVMQAAEKRIDEKIAKLQALQKSIDTVAQKQDDQDDARIKSLVHIYEAMKPQDAARIFEQLDLPVLISVIEHMREMKAAPILASMDPTKAKTVTLALAEQHSAPAASQSQSASASH